MNLSWVCYHCNLRFEKKESVELHNELTGHIAINEGLKNET